MKPSSLILQRLVSVVSIPLLASVAVAQETRQFFVSPGGNDAWTGETAEVNSTSGDGPLRTLSGARDRVREWREQHEWPAGGVRVTILDGTYVLDETVVLTEQDSGEENAPLVFAAADGATAIVRGGPAVPNWRPVDDPEILGRLDESARGKVVQASLSELGIADYGSPNGGGVQLYFDGAPMTLARWPNAGFVKIAEEAGGEKFDIRGRKGDRIGRWVYEGDRPSRWLNESDPWVHGYWFWDWSDQRHAVKEIDPAAHTIEVEKPYHGYGYRKGQWYYAFNLLSEIDQPGEWYLDRTDGTLYFWPPQPIESGEAAVTVLDTLVNLDSASHVQFEGVGFEFARSRAIHGTGGAGNQIAGCTIRNIGGDAVYLSGGTGHVVYGCDLYNLAGGGIVLHGGDRETLTPAAHTAANNHIYRYGQWYRMYKPAVSLAGVGHRVAHNLIHDAPHMAVQFSGNDHVIEYNEIYNVCQESNDAGAIYAGRDWTMRGTEIRHNYLHQIQGFEGRGCVGVYLDDMFCGTKIYGNLFYKVFRAAFIGGGRDNDYSNNVFVDCAKALHIDNRAQNWAADHIDTTMKDRLEAMPYRDEPWRSRFPELLTIWADEPAAPKGNRIARNVFIGENWDDITNGARPYIALEDNVVDGDVRFRDKSDWAASKTPRAVAFAFAPDSPGLPAGFEPLQLDKMGVYEDPRRASWPVQREPSE